MELEEFHLQRLAPWESILIVGGEKSGKTTLLIDLLSQKQESTNYYHPFNLHTFLKNCKNEYKQKVIQLRESNDFTPTIKKNVICDDTLDENDWLGSNFRYLRYLLLNGRLLLTNTLVTTTTRTSSVLFQHFDCFFLFPETDPEKRRTLYESCLIRGIDFETFERSMKKISEHPYMSLVYHNENLFYYKATC